MGLACAFSTPTAYTLIQERVPPARASLASSLYGTGVALGGALAALSILLDTQFGWRNALFIITAFAFGTSGLNAIILPDDTKAGTMAKSESARDSSDSIFKEVLEVVSTSRVQWLFLGSFLRFCSGLMIGVWSAPYFRQVFPDNQGQYAILQALITAICGVMSGLLGGVLADQISAQAGESDDGVGRKLWIPVVGSILAAPSWYLAVHSEPSFTLAMGWLAVEYLVAECWFGPTISVLQSTVGPKIGGTAQGLFTVTGAIGNLAPTILGFLYSQASGGGSVEASAKLANLLAIGVCGGYLSSAACFAASALSTPPPKDKAN
uniref:Major facilitator superfamily (MFS) profile domain-containing protein n=1 Tax=Cyclophora tenuis TaxID=216820 RepID=A0A7S1DCB4_CYCTE